MTLLIDNNHENHMVAYYMANGKTYRMDNILNEGGLRAAKI